MWRKYRAKSSAAAAAAQRLGGIGGINGNDVSMANAVFRLAFSRRTQKYLGYSSAIFCPAGLRLLAAKMHCIWLAFGVVLRLAKWRHQCGLAIKPYSAR